MALQFVLKADDQISPAANKGASSLQRLDAAIKQESRALATLENQMKALSRAGSTDIETGRKLNSMITDQRSKVAALTQSMITAGGAGFEATGNKASALEGALGQLSGSGGKLGQVLGKLGPYGMAAAAGIALVTGAAVAAGAAVGYLAGKLLDLGVAASEAKGDTLRSFELLYGSEKAALHTYRVIESLTQDIAISHGRALELSNSLLTAGMVNGDRMVAAIAAIGKAEAARAGAGKVLEGVIVRSQQSRMFGISRSELMQVGLSYKELAREISKGTGMAVGEAELRLRTGGVKLKEGLAALNRVIDTKMGDLANKKMMTVGAQAQRLKDTFGRLFENVNTGALARLLQVVGNMLDESNVSGAALRGMLSKMFDEMAAAAEAVAPYLQTFFEGGILMALKLYNALYPVRQSIKKLFGDSDGGGLESFENTVLSFANGVGKGFQVAALAIAWMIDNAGKLAKTIELLASAAPIVGPAFQAAVGAMRMALDMMASDGASAATKGGKNVSEGVAEGIRQGTPAVEAAMAAMGAKGVSAFDQKMQIRSPSRLMMIRGRYIDEGLAKGVNDNAQGPADAVGKMAGKAAGSADAGIADRSGSGRPGGASGSADGVVVHVTFANGAVVVQGGGSPAAIAETEDQLTELMSVVFERVNRIRATGTG